MHWTTLNYQPFLMKRAAIVIIFTWRINFFPQGSFSYILREPCYPEVTHHHINRAISLCRCTECRHLVQFAKLFVTEMPEHARKNCKVEIASPHNTILFWSNTGYQQNHFVFQTIDGTIYVTTMNESWRMWFERKASALWSSVKSAGAYIIQTILQLLPSAALSALQN